MAEDDCFFTGRVGEAGEGGKGIALAEEGLEEEVEGGEGEVGQEKVLSG